MGRPIMHFEIASPNLERAAAFYQELFDWEDRPETDGWISSGRNADGSIGGGLLRTPKVCSPT